MSKRLNAGGLNTLSCEISSNAMRRASPSLVKKAMKGGGSCPMITSKIAYLSANPLHHGCGKMWKLHQIEISISTVFFQHQVRDFRRLYSRPGNETASQVDVGFPSDA
jgi:hypothetical protein